MIVIRIILFPLLLLISLPIDLELWLAYKKLGYKVPNYIKYIWREYVLLKSGHNGF